MFNFNIIVNGLGLVSPSHLVHDFSRKTILMLYSVNWPSFIVWLPWLLEMLDNVCITIVCSPGCYFIKFEINLVFLIKLFCYMTKKSRQKFKYLKNENNFWDETKSIFNFQFSKLSIAKNCLRPRSVLLKVSLQNILHMLYKCDFNEAEL